MGTVLVTQKGPAEHVVELGTPLQDAGHALDVWHAQADGPRPDDRSGPSRPARPTVRGADPPLMRAIELEPRIGISAYWRAVAFANWREYPVTLVPQGYVDGVACAGGIPLVIPPIERFVEDPASALSGLGGLLLTGGEDVDPMMYGAKRHPATGEPNARRDAVELSLLREALSEDMPILAICRGAQLLNAARGGTLLQDMSEAYDLPSHLPEPGRFGRHRVDVIGGKLRELSGDVIASVASYHHQALDRIGEGLRVTGVATDGAVEGIEDPSQSFCIGVLWHPDEDARNAGAPLFEGLVNAARAYATRRDGAS